MMRVTVQNAALAATVVKPEQFPTDGLPEIAFAGKSNVGKSSLLNCMMNRKALARTSSAPGKTRTLNFYRIENRLMFVDLPGYGYAKVSKSETQKWGGMVEGYLTGRPRLIGVVMLVDIRHNPSVLDRQLYDWLRHYAFDIILIAAKSDKIKRAAVPRQAALIRKELDAGRDQIILPFSCVTCEGRDALWTHLEKKIKKMDESAAVI
ncbi:MAG: ribosome biogenesis GTP-binding protein YihA/YsxC [Clostridiales bacterium]|jgi:GTP-binding protein|nr:ribosome biogenesis GTP-binding protein YihA/YsxC [Clostridiales bacterium]